jgi:hypothetical protein
MRLVAHRRRPMVGLVAIALCVVAALAVSAAPALAGPGLHITVHNETTKGVAVALAATGENDCWFDKDLGRDNDENAVKPGQRRTFYTERSTYAFNSCGRSTATRGLVLKAKVPGGKWTAPAGEPAGTRLFFQTVPYGTRDLTDFGFQFHDSLTTWLPLPDGHGLICWRTAVSTFPDHGFEFNLYATGYADVWVYDDGRCNTPGPANVRDGDLNPITRQGASPRSATAAQSDDSSHAIADVLTTVGVLCPWSGYPGDTDRCDKLDVGGTSWSLDGVAKDVRSFKVTGVNPVNQPRESVASTQISIPPGAGSGTLSINQQVAVSNTTQTSTTNGMKAGGKTVFSGEFSWNVATVASTKYGFSQEISGEYNYSSTNQETTSQTASRQVQISYAAQPGYTSMLDVFMAKRSATYNYEADLDFGKDGVVQPVDTPGNVALNQSPARRQPCLAYMVGGAGTRNSIMNSGAQLLNAGYSATEPTLDPAQRGVLRSMPFWHTAGKPCPGFPAGFDSVAGFKGTGVGTYANLGYDDKGKPVNVVTACVFQAPFGTTPTAKLARAGERATPRQATGGGTPCWEQSTNSVGLKTRLAQAPPDITPGVLVDGDDDPAGSEVDGGATSDKIIGPEGGGTIVAGAGALDIVQAGDGDTAIEGGAGTNQLDGGAGNDTITGGPDSDTILGGAGNDRISDSGRGDLLAGAGDDVIAGQSLVGVVDGGAGNDAVTLTGDSSRAGVTDSAGDTTIDLIGTGTPTITVSPTAGTEILRTDHSLRAAPYIDQLIATGTAPVDLSATEGTTLIEGNDAPNVLRAGHAATTLRGGAGDDVIAMGADNDDTATGGPGADRFTSAGTPQRWTRPAGTRPAARTANTITDFDPAQGDRIVLRRAVYGAGVAALTHRFQAVSGRHPRPRRAGATLLFDTTDHVLSFDVDGRGPISDKVVAKLPGATRVTRRWVVVPR